ncbi:MAG: hypothetical protein UHI81_10950 [Olegusella sp.]|nr:hypothetical protein [Olegusella sp.]
MAIGFDEALARARRVKHGITNYVEYEDAFIFGDDVMEIGGSGPVVVLKDNGDCVNMPYYVSTSHDLEVVSEGRI